MDKQQRERKNSTLTHKITAIILCSYINWLVTFLLYKVFMEHFDISTDGFMNLNGLVTAALIWMAMAIILLVIASSIKELLGPLYRTIRATQLAFLSIPIILLIIFLFVISHK